VPFTTTFYYHLYYQLYLPAPAGWAGAGGPRRSSWWPKRVRHEAALLFAAMWIFRRKSVGRRSTARLVTKVLAYWYKRQKVQMLAQKTKVQMLATEKLLQESQCCHHTTSYFSSL
jgi:hypothetical protein